MDFSLKSQLPSHQVVRLYLLSTSKHSNSSMQHRRFPCYIPCFLRLWMWFFLCWGFFNQELLFWNVLLGKDIRLVSRLSGAYIFHWKIKYGNFWQSGLKIRKSILNIDKQVTLELLKSCNLYQKQHKRSYYTNAKLLFPLLVTSA